MKKIVLIVEDDRFCLDLLVSLVSECGHVPHKATNMTEAIETFNSKLQFDVVIADRHMGVGDEGCILSRTVRHIEHRRNTPPAFFVGISEDTCDVSASEWKRQGIDVFQPKPLTKDTLDVFLSVTAPPAGVKLCPYKFHCIDKTVMDIPHAWSSGVKSEELYLKMLSAIVSHPISVAIRKDASTFDVPTWQCLHQFEGVLRYAYARACADSAGNLVAVLKADILPSNPHVASTFVQDLLHVNREVEAMFKNHHIEFA